jgi:hypothetical protein
MKTLVWIATAAGAFLVASVALAGAGARSPDEIAAASLPRLGDMPAGFHLATRAEIANTVPDPDTPPTCRSDALAFPVATARTILLGPKKAPVAIQITADVFASTADASRAWRHGPASAFAACLGRTFLTRTGRQQGFRVVSARPFALPGIEDESEGYRVVASVALRKLRHLRYVDVVYVRRAEVIVSVAAAIWDTPLTLGDDVGLARLVSGRLQRAVP